MQHENTADLQAEVARMQEDLQLRDQLVQQLSQELFRLVKGNANGTNPVGSELGETSGEMRSLREQLHAVEQQVCFYQEQIANRDAELSQVQQSQQELTERNRMLEQVIQELPRIYREKFEQRLLPVKEKMAMIQQENRRLHAELQSVSYRLAVRNRQTGQLDLPAFPRGEGEMLPNLGGA
jgi:chromosome segregation ATPase